MGSASKALNVKLFAHENHRCSNKICFVKGNADATFINIPEGNNLVHIRWQLMTWTSLLFYPVRLITHVPYASSSATRSSNRCPIALAVNGHKVGAWSMGDAEWIACGSQTNRIFCITDKEKQLVLFALLRAIVKAYKDMLWWNSLGLDYHDRAGAFVCWQEIHWILECQTSTTNAINFSKRLKFSNEGRTREMLEAWTKPLHIRFVITIVE